MNPTSDLLSLTSDIFTIQWQDPACCFPIHISDNFVSALPLNGQQIQDFTELLPNADIVKTRQTLLTSTDAEIIEIPIYHLLQQGRERQYLREEIIRKPGMPFTSIFIDVTELVSQREMAKHNKERLELVLQGTRLGMWDWNPQTNDVVFDDRWADMLGLNLADMSQTLADWQDRVHPEDIEACFADIQDHIEGRTEFYENLHRMMHKDGQWRYILDRGKVVERDHDNQPIRFTGTHTDVTSLKQAELKATNALQARNRFFANMSHELRTPLHGILNLAEFALVESDLAEKDKVLTTILSSTQILSNIVNDILDFSKIEAGKLEIEEVEFEPRNLIHTIIEPLQHLANNKGIDLNCEFNGSLAGVLKGDPIRLSQIINNLCANAIKFTEDGSVTLQVTAMTSENKQQQVQFDVIDTGIGISAEAQPNLFKAFHQADASTSRKYGGTGLGLSICVKLCELMGGQLSFTSELGTGSTFSYCQSFSVSARNKVKQTDDLLVNLQQAAVLVAEDNLVNQTIIDKMLARHNANLTIVENGQACVDYFCNHSVDLIFMDVQMPIKDGIQATRDIRAMATGRKVPIVAMTANTMKEDIEHYLEIGMNGYITKPFSKTKLNSLLNVFNPTTFSQNFERLSVFISDPNKSNSAKLTTISQTLKTLIPNANRVSLWLFNEHYDQINCLSCLDESEQISTGLVLKATDFPDYFTFILSSQILDASDARQHPVTTCFNSSYFEPLNIHSLLDYIFYMNDVPLGVICCESVGKQVDWTIEDQQNLIKIADVTTLFFATSIDKSAI